MKNIDKGVEITGKTAEYLINNECVFDVGIVPLKCDEDCYECWHRDFIGMIPECFKECYCDTCQKYEELCCVNKKDECKGNCIMRLA